MELVENLQRNPYLDKSWKIQERESGRVKKAYIKK